MTDWMIVTSPENYYVAARRSSRTVTATRSGAVTTYERTRELGFTVQGVKSRHRRKAERMAPGDRVCWYLTGRQAFAATATITSRYFEGKDAIWVSEKTGDTYPWRFQIRKDHALDPERAVPATSLLDELRFVKRWPSEHWRLAFQGNVHELDDADFALIEGAVERAEREGKAA